MQHTRSTQVLGIVLFVALALSLGGTAAAFSFGPTEVFAKTRADSVAWKANTTIETNSLVVKANSIVFGSQELDLQPDAGKAIQVNIQRWGIDIKEFRVLVTSGTTSSLSFKSTNPGFTYVLVQDGVSSQTCLPENATCVWSLSSASSWLFSIATPAGEEQLNSGEQDTSSSPTSPPPSSGGGGGGGGGTGGDAPLKDIFGFLPPDANPAVVFPHFSGAQWAGFLLGMFLVVNGNRLTSRFLHPRLRLPAGFRLPYLAGGIMLAILAYFG